MARAHKIRLNPTLPPEAYFCCASGVARFAWNWVLEEYKRRKAAGQEIDWNKIKIEFRARIKTEFPFVREVTKCAAEVAIADLRVLVAVRLGASGSYLCRTAARTPWCLRPHLRKIWFGPQMMVQGIESETIGVLNKEKTR